MVSDNEIPKEVLIVIKMTDLIELECPFVGCDLGVAGSKYKTPELDQDKALRMMKLHAKSHAQGPGGEQRRQEPGDGCFTKPEKTRRPTLQKGISEDRYLTFERQWARYKKSTGMQDEAMIRNTGVTNNARNLVINALRSRRKLAVRRYRRGYLRTGTSPLRDSGPGTRRALACRTRP